MKEAASAFTGTGIDVHGHAVPPALVAEVQRAGDRYGGISVETSDGKTVFTFPGEKPLRPVPRGMQDTENRLRWLDSEQLEAQVFGPWLDIAGYQLDVEDGVRWIAFVNEAVAEMARQSNGRLYGLATLPLADPARAAKELERATKELGLVGAMLPTHFRHGQASEPWMDAVWEAAASLSAPIMLHPPIEGPASAIPNSTEFRSLYGRPLETTFVTATLLVGGLFERFPNLKLILAHGGGFIPFQAGRLDNYYDIGTLKGPLPAGKKPSDYLDRLYYDSTLMSARAVEFLTKLAGPDHVLLGSDYPFTIGAPPILDAPRAAGLDADSLRLLARESAAALFGIGTS